MSTHPSKKSLLTTGVGNPPRRQEVWRPSSTTRGIWCIKRVATSGALPLRQILWISWWTGPAEGAVTMGNAGRFWRSKYGDPKSVVQAGKDILDEMSKFSYITSLLYIYMHPKYFLTRYESLKSPKTFPQKVRLGPWGKVSRSTMAALWMGPGRLTGEFHFWDPDSEIYAVNMEVG